MKKNLFTLLALLALLPTARAQQNFPFPASDAEWITTRVSGCIGGSNIYNLWREYLGADTLLQGVAYRQLILQPECTLITQGLNCDYSLTPYQGPAFAVGGIRTDSNQRVYFQKFNLSPFLPLSVYEKDLLSLPTGVDVLLYDFNWVVGDTLAAQLDGGNAKLYAVTAITTLPSGRKKFQLHHLNGIGYNHEVVEGAGNTMGLFGNYSDPAASSYLPLEGCFNHNGVQVLDLDNCNFCGSVSTNPEPRKLSFSVFPNPADDFLNIQPAQENTAPYLLKVYDLLGHSLFEQTECSGITVVSTARWPAQTCVLSLTDPLGGNTLVQKIQVQH